MAEPFPDTRWSLVLGAGAGEREALDGLCRAYWQPLYAFARRSGLSEQDALDLVQGLVADLLARGSVAAADPDKGRFRSFMIGALKNHIGQERRRSGRLKRGGNVVKISIDAELAEERYQSVPSHDLTPEKLYLRQWTRTAIERARQRTAAAYNGPRKQLYSELSCLLSGDSPEGGYLAVAERLGSTQGAIKVAAYRLKKRFQKELREEVAQTLSESGDVDAELRELMAALR